VKIYIYPVLDENSGELIRIRDLCVQPAVCHLLNHLIDNRLILDVPNVNTKHLGINPTEIPDLIRHHADNWETMVPVFIAKRIKERKLFGYTSD
jgi:hypothetical protein